jgi:hypothetical protein
MGLLRPLVQALEPAPGSTTRLTPATPATLNVAVYAMSAAPTPSVAAYMETTRVAAVRPESQSNWMPPIFMPAAANPRCATTTRDGMAPSTLVICGIRNVRAGVSEPTVAPVSAMACTVAAAVVTSMLSQRPGSVSM